jgi:hypothetical protein
VDNVIKPILDALKDEIYQDDKNVYRVISERVDRNKVENVPVASPTVQAVWGVFAEFIHIVVFWDEE